VTTLAAVAGLRSPPLAAQTRLSDRCDMLALVCRSFLSNTQRHARHVDS
jgi:hypothetical protein